MQYFFQPTSNLDDIELAQASENRSDIDPLSLCLIPVLIGITIYHFLHSWLFDKIMQRECIFAVLWQNLHKYAPSIDLNVFISFLITVTDGESQEIFTSSSQTTFFNFNTVPLPSVASLIFLHGDHPKFPQKLNKFSISSESLLICYFFVSKKVPFFGDSTGTRTGTGHLIFVTLKSKRNPPRKYRQFKRPPTSPSPAANAGDMNSVFSNKLLHFQLLPIPVKPPKARFTYHHK